ncbi:hypothetical protein CC78DRAFT_57770 [Lojkania enalia]|uniref:Uncharacterized protein n=1 Tax=Lojkania enalia TaxID=147567 RepID=A0A9P4N5K1_9PLEO|nr:hypothetical protein CC78DRAFT_57770 [Didymosphaeria enalia]
MSMTLFLRMNGLYFWANEIPRELLKASIACLVNFLLDTRAEAHGLCFVVLRVATWSKGVGILRNRLNFDRLVWQVDNLVASRLELTVYTSLRFRPRYRRRTCIVEESLKSFQKSIITNMRAQLYKWLTISYYILIGFQNDLTALLTRWEN